MALAAEPEAHPAILVLRWPAERSQRERLVVEGRARLLLVSPNADPPSCVDCLEDWVRVPADEGDVAARLRALDVRVACHQRPPQTDDRGRLTFNDDWVALSPIEERI